jgi:hypothetical protein
VTGVICLPCPYPVSAGHARKQAFDLNTVAPVCASVDSHDDDCYDDDDDGCGGCDDGDDYDDADYLQQLTTAPAGVSGADQANAGVPMFDFWSADSSTTTNGGSAPSLDIEVAIRKSGLSDYTFFDDRFNRRAARQRTAAGKTGQVDDAKGGKKKTKEKTKFFFDFAAAVKAAASRAGGRSASLRLLRLLVVVVVVVAVAAVVVVVVVAAALLLLLLRPMLRFCCASTRHLYS